MENGKILIKMNYKLKKISGDASFREFYRVKKNKKTSIIVHAKNRERAIIRMQRALEETIIDGPKTTIPYQLAIMKDSEFKSGTFDTSFLETFNFKEK